MGFPKARNIALLAASTSLALGNVRAYADDTEIFVGNPGNAAAPNIMFILDTSGSMGSNVTTTEDYDPARTYSGTGDCSGINGQIYYSTDGTVPSCDGPSFQRSLLKCRDALSTTALGTGGAGLYIGTFVRWGGNKNRSWQAKFDPKNAADVECKVDDGVDGNLSSTNPYPTSGTSTSASGVWVGSASNSYWQKNTGLPAALYDGNYIVYWNQFQTVTIGTRMSIMQNAAVNLLNALSGVNVGLMRYSRNDVGSGDKLASGGMVAYPIGPIATNRANLVAEVKNYTAAGYTPLSETLFEAYRYFSGGQVLFGNSSVPFHSVASARDPATDDGANYESPADASCQKNYIVYLTDGLPTADSEANTEIQKLLATDPASGTCAAAGSGPDPGWKNSGLCLEALARYMYNADLRPDAGPNGVNSKQNVTSYWIGFGNDVAGGVPFQYLDRAARAGSGGGAGSPGTGAYTAQDSAGLTSVLTEIVTSILQTSTTFTAPTVAVNAFNRTRSLNDLYVSVFQPSSNRHWPGNLKKYRVKATTSGAVVVGKDAALPAIDAGTGFFADNAQSFWSASPDGPRVRDGGAANRLLLPDGRNLYTFLGTNPSNPTPLKNSLVTEGNAAITDAMLGIGGTGDPSRVDLFDWIRGKDVLDEYPWSPQLPNKITTESRRAMGDPIHAQPAIIIYGGSVGSPNIDDAAAFVPTNDGYLHAFDTQTGDELWAFIPQEFLAEQKDLYENAAPLVKNYLLDGEVRVLKFDVNGDGIVTQAAGDRVVLYFGQGRGGSDYYALDVTDKTDPQFMWRIGAADLPGIGSAWSAPTIARVNVSGQTQNSQKLVLVIGGGYDSIEDNTGYVTADAVGNRLYFVDALRGATLWSAGLTSAPGADFTHGRMTHSFPAGITVLDTNSDGFADRMYTGDMAAQLWRFDITNGNPKNTLVAGGVIASLGSHDESPHLPANTRRFYNAPDVAAIQRVSGGPFLNIAIGSGYRGHPLSTSAQDRFYSIQDFKGFTAMTQNDYNNLTIIRESSLVDVTTDVTPTIPPGSVGWMLSFNQPGGSWIGEKSLGQATTINNNIVFTTYTPNTGAPSADPCAPTFGTNRAYAVKVFDGSPVHIDGTADPTDRYSDFNFGGIAGDISTMVLGSDEQPCTGDNCPPPCTGPNCPLPPGSTQFVCLAGVRVLDVCRDFDSRVKTYWRESGAN